MFLTIKSYNLPLIYRRIQAQYDHLDKEYREHAIGVLRNSNCGKVSVLLLPPSLTALVVPPAPHRAQHQLRCLSTASAAHSPVRLPKIIIIKSVALLITSNNNNCNITVRWLVGYWTRVFKSSSLMDSYNEIVLWSVILWSSFINSRQVAATYLQNGINVSFTKRRYRVWYYSTVHQLHATIILFAKLTLPVLLKRATRKQQKSSSVHIANYHVTRVLLPPGGRW